MYAGGRTLQDDLPADSYRAFAEECAKSGLDIEFLKPMRPWLAALTCTQAALARLGFDPRYGIELHFLSELPANRTVIELESMERQIDLLAGLSPELQAAFLEQTVAEAARLPETAGRMKDLWKSGDGEKLAEFAERSFDAGEAGMSALYRKLIVDRNAEMSRAIAGYLAVPKTYFVIVGAGHLLGSRGIVALLRAQGFAAAAPLAANAGER